MCIRIDYFESLGTGGSSSEGLSVSEDFSLSVGQVERRAKRPSQASAPGPWREGFSRGVGLSVPLDVDFAGTRKERGEHVVG